MSRPWTYRCGQRTVRLAGYSGQWSAITPRSLRAQAQLTKTRTETMELEERRAESNRTIEVREQALPTSQKPIC
ncbi:hypothetical protein TNCV_2319661 [Trichonephila clavipes]|nr:hypothetical protein TNCV_2319661 [Trichonephila clavipes]